MKSKPRFGGVFYNGRTQEKAARSNESSWFRTVSQPGRMEGLAGTLTTLEELTTTGATSGTLLSVGGGVAKRRDPDGNACIILHRASAFGPMGVN